MAVIDSLKRSFLVSSVLTKEVNASKREVSNVKTSIDNISRIVESRTKVKSDLISRSTILENRRREADRRREIEDSVSASKISTSPSRGLLVAQSSGQGPLGRILTFLGFLGAGWILENLPTWIAIGKEFIKRVRLTGQILFNFVNNVGSVIGAFGNLLSSAGKNIISLDLFDSSDRIKNSFDELIDTTETLGSQIREGFIQLMQPLGIQVPGLEEQRPEAYQRPESPASMGGSGQLLAIHQQALDIISGPESGGDYNAMNNGQAGDRPGGSKRWLGKNLTDMTIAEIKYHQTVKKDLWAAGRYQFVPNTLPGVAASTGLKDSDMFNKQNQDLMAATLLKQRGIQPWTVGGSKYSQKELQIVEQARRTPFGSGQGQTNSGTGKGTGTNTAGGKIYQYLHGEPGRSGYEPKGHWNHDHFSFTTRAAAVKAFEALRAKGFKPYEFEGYTRVGKHSATGGHFGPAGGKPTYNDTSDGTAFDIPYSSYGSGPIGPKDYAKSREAYKIVMSAIGGSSSAESQPPPTPQAQVSSAGTGQQLSQEITPERRGQEIVLLDDPRPSYGGGSGLPAPSMAPSGGGVTKVSQTNMLNNFIKNKLLLDLAYL